MKNTKIHPTKFIIFAFIPLIILVLMAEAACRIKYFVMHKNWNFITAPFVIVPFQRQDPGAWMPPTTNQSKDGQLAIKWHKPCINREVFSEHYKKLMPYTYDEFCFRGDRIKLDKEPSEFRIFVVGGSTVEDLQSDEEMWTRQLKFLLTKAPKNKIIKVINAGQSGYNSAMAFFLYRNKIIKFKPELVLYYEAVNEQIGYNRWIDIDYCIGTLMNNKLHKLLYNKSLLYTYLVEKYHFMTVEQRRLWVINLQRLKESLLALNRDVTNSGAQMVFVTQIVNAPRYIKEVDTFNYKAVSNLLNSLKSDPNYIYDTSEISALNQRLAVFYSIEICKEYGIPYINILDEIEALGSVERNKLFCIDDPIHTTPEGNRLIAKLIGTKLNGFLKDR